MNLPTRRKRKISKIRRLIHKNKSYITIAKIYKFNPYQLINICEAPTFNMDGLTYIQPVLDYELSKMVKKFEHKGYKLKVSFEDFFKFMERIKTE